MDLFGMLLVIFGAALVIIALFLAMSNKMRSFTNLFVPFCLRIIKEGFFATGIGVETMLILGGMFLFFGVVAVV